MLMRSTFYLLLLTTIFIWGCSGTESEKTTDNQTANQQETAPTADKPARKKPLSPKREAMAMVGENHIHIDYSSPSVRGRVIWGGLVPYNQVWSTGAHKATAISFGKDVIIDGNPVPAGKYGFFTIPGEEKWTLILNKNWNQHLADEYDEAEDVVRMSVTPEKLPDLQESLTYQVEALNDSTARISVSWEHLKVSFEVRNK